MKIGCTMYTPVVQEEEVQVENDGSKNPTSKCPQTSVDVAVQKAGK